MHFSQMVEVTVVNHQSGQVWLPSRELKNLVRNCVFQISARKLAVLTRFMF